MKIPETRAAARRYGLRQDRLGAYPDVSEDYGLVHALMLPHRMHNKNTTFRDPEFLEWSSQEAVCVLGVGLGFPVPFDTDEDGACPDCLDMAALWVNDRDEYRRRVRERAERRWVARGRGREDEEAEHDYEEFQRRQDADLRGGERRQHGEAG